MWQHSTQRRAGLFVLCFAALGLILLAAYQVTDLRITSAGVVTETRPKSDSPSSSDPAPAADGKQSPDGDNVLNNSDHPNSGLTSQLGVADKAGEFYHVRPSRPSSREAAVPGCKYPILIHTTPDDHCTGVLALYGSIIRNVLMQPDALQGKTCVHLTYVDDDLRFFETMYQWQPQPNPFGQVPDCAKLDPDGDAKALSAIVPFRWQAITASDTPAIMQGVGKGWRQALNKVNSWAFDLYPRALYMDADSILVRDLASIFDEVPAHITVAGAPDQVSCRDRDRINGGMILLRPSRYFHIAASEALQDPQASCQSGRWALSEQELINCLCGYNLPGKEQRALRPEFVCTIMPIYNSIWPTQYQCSDANVVPVRSLHWAALRKPWKVPDKEMHRFDHLFWRCVRDHTRVTNVTGLLSCSVPDSEEMRVQYVDGYE